MYFDTLLLGTCPLKIMSSWRIDPFLFNVMPSLSLSFLTLNSALSKITIGLLIDQCSWVYFLIHSDDFCLLIGVFIPSTFKVVMDIVA